jgi:translation initiation factor 2 subunit 2
MVKSYEALLETAYSQISEPETETGRWSCPEPKVMLEGKTTILENFGDILSSIRRDEDHFMKYLLSELGTAGKIDGLRAIFNGKFEESQFNMLVSGYIQDYVICSECGKPDTRLVKDDRVLILRCDACGSHRPVRKRKTRTFSIGSSMEVGSIIDATISSVSKRGDGVARSGKYIIYVENAKPGQVVKVKIARISGSIIFTERV